MVLLVTSIARDHSFQLQPSNRSVQTLAKSWFTGEEVLRQWNEDGITIVRGAMSWLFEDPERSATAAQPAAQSPQPNTARFHRDFTAKFRSAAERNVAMGPSKPQNPDFYPTVRSTPSMHAPAPTQPYSPHSYPAAAQYASQLPVQRPHEVTPNYNQLPEARPQVPGTPHDRTHRAQALPYTNALHTAPAGAGTHADTSDIREAAAYALQSQTPTIESTDSRSQSRPASGIMSVGNLIRHDLNAGASSIPVNVGVFHDRTKTMSSLSSEMSPGACEQYSTPESATSAKNTHPHRHQTYTTPKRPHEQLHYRAQGTPAATSGHYELSPKDDQDRYYVGDRPDDPYTYPLPPSPSRYHPAPSQYHPAPSQYHPAPSLI
ncbi:hypothetical protein BDZ91DRAFT_847249 [Kalaharituber pfeilii]|nr:hypothetical protein BDZ91DRAFT_847249 [Kalaharituber pfeilii]